MTKKKSKIPPEVEAMARVLLEEWEGKDFFPKLKKKAGPHEAVNP